MKEQLKQRLEELKTEYESGQKVLQDLETKQTNVRETLLRIAGAIQVLEEELTKVEQQDSQETNISELTKTEIVTESYSN